MNEKGDCDDEDPTINNIDEDGDGLGLCSGDCDDTDPDIKRLNRYLDVDGDGYGDASSGVFHLCDETDGYVTKKIVMIDMKQFIPKLKKYFVMVLIKIVMVKMKYMIHSHMTCLYRVM